MWVDVEFVYLWRLWVPQANSSSIPFFIFPTSKDWVGSEFTDRSLLLYVGIVAKKSRHKIVGKCTQIKNMHVRTQIKTKAKKFEWYKLLNCISDL